MKKLLSFHKGRPTSPRKLTTFASTLTKSDKKLTTFHRKLTTFAENSTTSPAKLTPFPRKPTTFRKNPTTLPEELTTFAENLTTSPAKLSTFPKNSTTFPKNRSAFRTSSPVVFLTNFCAAIYYVKTAGSSRFAVEWIHAGTRRRQDRPHPATAILAGPAFLAGTTLCQCTYLPAFNPRHTRHSPFTSSHAVYRTLVGRGTRRAVIHPRSRRRGNVLARTIAIRTHQELPHTVPLVREPQGLKWASQERRPTGCW